MSTTSEKPLVTPDGASLHTKSWLPSSAPTAQILFIHGFSDHGGRYVRFFPLLAERGIAVHALDQRGWGRSVKTTADRGKTGPTAQVMDDISLFVKSYLPSTIPIFLMGHSMGGQETLYWASTGPEDLKKQLSGFIALGPWIQLHPKTQPGWLKVSVGRLASYILPHHQLVNPLDQNLLSHDEVENQDWADDKLCHDTCTLEGLGGALTRADELHYGTVKLQDYEGLRLLVVHGGADAITSAPASELFVKNAAIKNKEVKIYDDLYHNVHTDAPERLRDDILEFISKAPGSTQGQSKL